MRKARINQGIAGAMTLVMVLGQAPTSAFAEALNSPEWVATDQQADAPAANTDAGDAAEGTSGSGVASAPAQQDELLGQNGTSNDTSAADTVVARATAPTATGTTFSYHGDSTTKKALYDFIYSNFSGSFTRSAFKLLDSTRQEVVSLNKLNANNDLVELVNGATYTVQYWRARGNTWIDCGKLKAQSYWNANFSVSGWEGGGARIDNKAVSGVYPINSGDSKAFTVVTSDDYTASVTIDGNTATPNADRSYAIPSSADSSISIAYTPATQATITLAPAEGVGAVTVGGATADTSGNIVVNYKNPGNIAVTPAEGYAITGIKLVNDADGSEVALANPTFSNRIATVAGVPALTKDGNYTLTVETVKAGVKGIDGSEVGIIGREKNRYDAIVFAAAFDQAGSVPAGLTLDDVTITYNAGGTFGDRWKALDFTPGLLDFGTHEFGGNGDGSTEKIRITYDGNDQYPGSSVELTVTIADGRYKTQMSCNTGVSIQYNGDASAMRDALYKALDPRVTYINNEGATVSVPNVSADDFEFEGLTLPADAGEYTGVTVKYKGTTSEGDQLGYQPCSVDNVTVTVTKAPSTLKVTSKKLTYGQTVTIADLVSSKPSNEETKPITVIAGIDGDATGYASIDLSYYSPTVQNIINRTLHLDQGVSMDELLDILNNDTAMNLLKIALKGAGVENPDQLVDNLRNVLTSLQKYGLGSSTIALGGTPSKAGVYVVAAGTASGNYKTSLGMGYLTIAPKTANVELVWKQELPNKVLGYNEVQDFDFGAKALDGDDDVTQQANVHVAYAGVTTTGEAYLSSEAPRTPGTYTETATVVGGNYLAKPISRAFSIGRAQTTVTLEGDTFTYSGKPQGPAAAVVNAAGDPIDDAVLAYLYSGVTAAGNVYLSTSAPTEAGKYVVSVAFVGDAQYGSSSNTASFTISKASATIIMNDDTVTYDGSAHGLVATATIPGDNGAIVDVTDQLTIRYGDKDEVPTDASSYEVTAIFPGNDNAERTSVKATLTIAPRPVTIAPSAQKASKVSGTSDPQLSYTIVDDAAQTAPWNGTDSLESTVENALSPAAKRADTDEEPGEHVVEASTGKSDANFEVTLGTCTLTILPSVTITNPQNGTVELSGDALIEEEGAKGAPAGSQLELTAQANEGYKFCGWKVVSGDATLSDADAEHTTLTVGQTNAEVAAKFEFAWTPIGPAMINVKCSVANDKGGSAISTPAAAYTGGTVTITATPDEGYEFDHWEVQSGDIELADASAATTTFVLGSTQPHVIAHFKKVVKPTPTEPTDPTTPTDPTKPTDKTDKTDNGNSSKTAASANKGTESKKDASKLAGTGDHAIVFAPIAAVGVIIACIGAALLRRRRQ